MPGFTLADDLALAVFAFAWIAYQLFVERSPTGRRGLNSLMNDYRIRWMMQMVEREVRIVDTQIMGSLQNGTAFFASTSLILIGGAAALLRATDDVLRVFSDLPFGLVATRGLWEAKVLGLIIIFGYAFFKFAWAFRLFSYAAVLIGATPIPRAAGERDCREMALRAAEMSIVAGRHFTRGQRAFFFALAYFGWFLSPYVLIVSTAAMLVVMWRRQFSSDAYRAVTLQLPLDQDGALGASTLSADKGPGSSASVLPDRR